MDNPINCFVHQIGKTKFEISVKSADSAKETLDSKLRKLIAREAVSEEYRIDILNEYPLVLDINVRFSVRFRTINSFLGILR